MDNHVTRDPNTADSRLYVGGLPEVVNRTDLEAHFQKFGEIVGFSLNKGFGFIQFKEVNSAQDAFKHPSPTISGRRLVIKPAANSSWGQEAMAQQGNLHNDNKRMPKVWNTGASGGGGGGGSGSGAPPMNIGPLRTNMPQHNGNNMNPNSSSGASFEPTNDCEIIVMSRALTTYAESIETRLRILGLTVDLLFPNSEVPLGKVLSNISGRGCLYAILVTPLNEEHRSITVNILYGPAAAQHRNMPVDDAIKFIDSDFISYRNSLPSKGGADGVVTIHAHRHSDAIQQLLQALAENRKLTVLQYDTIIQYLQERREIQIKDELGDAAATMMPEKTEEQKLQEKILTILEKPTMAENMASIEVEASSMVLANGLEILLDCKVQRALDSLLRSCVGFK